MALKSNRSGAACNPRLAAGVFKACAEVAAFASLPGVPRRAPTEMTERHRSVLELNTAVLLWGGTALFAKWIALPPFQITGLRSVVAALALLAVLRWQGHRVSVQGRRDFWLLMAGGVAMAAHWVTYFQAIQVSTVAVGILALHTYPVMTALVEPLVFRERLRALDALLALVVLAGVAIVSEGITLTMLAMERSYASLLESYLQIFPCAALLGVRQCGKTTLLQTLLW